MVYHASQTAGIRSLEPRISNHGKPLVYFSRKRENVLVYLSNAIEKHGKESGLVPAGPWTKWGTYGFTKDGFLHLDEYYPGALEETYKGVSAYIYCAESGAHLKKLEGVPDAYISETPVPVLDCEFIADAYEEILRAQKSGRIVLRRYETATPDQLQWIRDTMTKEFRDPCCKDDYRHFLLDKFPFLRGL